MGENGARRWVLGLLWPNLTVLLVVATLHLGGRATGPELRWIAEVALLCANLTAILALLLLPPLLDFLARGSRVSAGVFTAGVLAITAAGCLAAQLALLGLGLLDRPRFWELYLQAMSLGIPLALAFGLGSFFHESLRARVRQAEQRLHEREMAEERSRKLALEARLRSLEARLHPHFLFNTLNSIAALVAVKPDQAERLVGRLSGLLRSSLDLTARPLVPLREERELLQDYLEIERVRLGGELRARIAIPPDLLGVEVPPLSIQSLVENAVKHGIAPRRGGGELSVVATGGDGQLVVEVSDSGPGFDLSSVPAGHGIENLVARLDALYGSRASLAVSRRDGRCVVEMRVPRPGR